jgi:hypothetical protein
VVEVGVVVTAVEVVFCTVNVAVPLELLSKPPPP